MSEQDKTIARIREQVQSGRYRVRLHAVRHMIEEGFDENQLLEAVNGKLRLLEEYADESRYLLLGYFHFSSQSRSPLHFVCDLSNTEKVDFVTTYIPQRPWWETPTQRGQR